MAEHAEFAHQPLAREAAELLHRVDAQPLQAALNPPPDAADIGEDDAPQHPRNFRRRHVGDAVRLVKFGDELGDHLVRADADGAGDGGPQRGAQIALHLLGEHVRIAEARGHLGDIHERLVNGEGLHPVGITGEHAQRLGADFAVHVHVGAHGDEVRATAQRLVDVQPHLHPARLRLGGGGDDGGALRRPADADGLAAQRGIGLLHAAGVEGVVVEQEDQALFRRLRAEGRLGLRVNALRQRGAKSGDHGRQTNLCPYGILKTLVCKYRRLQKMRIIL
ncbi:MAG: hypothetical protein BWY76_02299 [bacterium ADurb.Bin429]|nr:MAG: hypothetical protein BWY76_02299 [bacterium ADurb.Bin429]